MKIRMATPLFAALLLMPAAWAQASASAARAPKIGVVNIQAAISGTAEGKQASAQLQSQFAPRRAELTKLQKQIQDVRTRLQTGQTTLSVDEKQRLTDEGNELTRRLQRGQQDAQDDFNDAQQEAVNRIGRKLLQVLDKYAKANGYTLILDSSSQQSPVLYRADDVDLTQEMIRLYDQDYPVKAAAKAPSRPAVRKPASKK